MVSSIFRATNGRVSRTFSVKNGQLHSSIIFLRFSSIPRQSQSVCECARIVQCSLPFRYCLFVCWNVYLLRFSLSLFLSVCIWYQNVLLAFAAIRCESTSIWFSSLKKCTSRFFFARFISRTRDYPQIFLCCVLFFWFVSFAVSYTLAPSGLTL